MSSATRPVFAANWKMNHGPPEAAGFMRAFVERYPPRRDRTVVFFPAAPALHVVVEAVRERPDLQAGVQNIYWQEKGAFTGEISAPIARAAEARFVLVGHSERRHVFGETDEDTARKCEAAARWGLTPVLCVGERLEERERGETTAVVLRQLRAGLSLLPTAAELLVAYEPVWAIGTGRNATPDDAAEVHVAIRAELRSLQRGAADVPILYGGSVKRENAGELLGAREVGGVLVGGASLDPEVWAAIAST